MSRLAPSPRSLALLFAICLALIIALADTGRLGFLHRLYDFPYGDKVAHLVLYFLLTLLVTATAQQRQPLNRRGLRFAVVGAAIGLVATLEELSQIWLPARSLDTLDLVASYVGITIGICTLVLSELARSLRTSSQKPPLQPPALL